MEDMQIIALYWQRDESAVAESLSRYGAYCEQIARNILADPEDAKECVNDALLRAWNGIPPARPDNLQFYLAKITRNLALDRYRMQTAAKRGKGVTQIALEELSQCAVDPDDPQLHCQAKELEMAVNRFVISLPEREGNVFIRRYFFMEKAKTIGRRYGISENYVMVILSRTRRKLKDFLKKEGLI